MIDCEKDGSGLDRGHDGAREVKRRDPRPRTGAGHRVASGDRDVGVEREDRVDGRIASEFGPQLVPRGRDVVVPGHLETLHTTREGGRGTAATLLESDVAFLVDNTKHLRRAIGRELGTGPLPSFELGLSNVGESAELLENFQWLTEEQSRRLNDEQKNKIAMEVADVFIYLLQVCDSLNIDPMLAAERKIVLNEQKYPVERARGSSRKYTDL